MPENKKYIDITKGDDIHQRALTYPDSQADDELNMTHSDYDVTPTISGPAWKVATKDAAWENDMNLDNPIRSVGVEGIGDSTYDQAIQSEEDLKDLNEVRAREQWGLTKLAGGLGKFGVETVNTTVGNIVGTVVGIYQGIYNSFDENPNTTFWNGLWNNGITEVQNSIREWQENAMPTYRSRAEQNMSPIRSIFTASGFADLMAQAGFTSGMLLSTWLTGGMGAGSGAASLLKMAGASKKTVNFAYRLISGIMGSVSEASMEGLNNYNDSKEHYMEKLREQYNVQKSQIEQQMQDELKSALIQANPTLLTDNPIRDIEQENAIKQSIYEKYASQIASLDQQFVLDSQNIENRALSVGSMTFGLNMAILGFSNTLGTLSFLKAPSVNTERQISKGLLSPLFRRKAATEAAEAPLGEGISKLEARAIGIREGLSEGFEESNQKWASNLAEQYYASDYDPEAKNKFSRFLETAGETFKTTYSDPETWKEFLMGAITGLGGTFNVAGVAKLISGQKVKASDFWQGGVIEAWREGTALAERSQQAYNEMNKLVTDKKLQDNFRLGTFMLASRERQIEAAARGDKLAYENENDAQTLRMIQTFANAGELNTLSALVGRNENLSDEELNALVEGLTEKNEEKYGDNKYHSDYSYLLTENGERISDILDKDDPRRKEAKEKIAKESKRIQDMIKSYQQAINKADSKTGYSLGVEELNLHAWGMVQADRADERMKEIIDKRLDVLKSIKPSQSYISENAVKSIDKTVKQLEKELARENKKPDSEEKTKNVEALNRSIESLNRYKETGKNNNIANDILQSLLSEGNTSVIAGWLNTKIGDDRYVADEILESLDDNGLLNDDLKRDINDVVRLFKARHNYDQLVNEWAQNPQEVIDLMDRQAKAITDRHIKDLAEKFNEEFKNANIRSVKDFKYKLPRILKKLGVTDTATLQAVNQKAGQTNRDLVLYGNSIAYQDLLKDRVNRLEGADDRVKQIANDLLNRKDILYQKIKYANKNQIARLLTQGMRLSAELMEVAERAASLIYVAKEELRQSQESTESDAKANEAAQEDTVETNEETPPNASETPTSDSTATDPVPEHQNQQILQMEYDSEDWSNVQWEVASTLKSEEVDSLIKNLVSIEDTIDPEAISIVNNLISQYSTCLVMSVKDKDFLAIADRIKNALTLFYQKANLPLAFIYDSVSNDKNEVETLFKSNSGLNFINIDFQDNDQVPDNMSLITMVEVSEKQGFHQMNITVLRGKQTQQPIEVKAKDEDGLETQIEVEDSESTQTEETQEKKEENPEQFSEDSENKQDLVTTEQTFVGETTVEPQNVEEAEQEVEETEEELTELPQPPADVMPIVAGEENQTEQKREEKEISLDDVANLFSLQDIDTNKVTIKAYEKPWKNNPNKSNKTLRIYLKGQEDKGYFELVKDEEYGYYSVHFKTATDNPNAKYNAENTTVSTKEERNILFEQLANAIPNGSKVSTWGSISPEGQKAIDKLGKLFNGKVVEHRTLKSKVDDSDVSIPVYQKGEAKEQPEAPKVEQSTQQQPAQTPTPKRKSEFGHTIATVKRPKTEVTQNAVVWADSFKYAEPEKGSIDFETEKAINEMLLPLFKESDTYNYIHSGKLAEFLKNNPDAPLYVKALPIKVNGKNPTSTASYVFGLYVKDNGRYILVGYKERGLSASKRSDYAITNNMYDAIFGFEQHYPEAYYNNNELVTTATNIEFVPTKNDDGYYTFTNKEGKPFAINKIAATPVPQTPNRRRPTSDVKVGNKSLEQAYNDGEIMLGFNWGKGKKLTLTGKGNPVETTSKITNTGGVIVAFKGSDGELTQCGVVGRALSPDLIDRNSDNSIVKAIVSEIDKLQKALNDKNTDRAKEIIIKQLSKYVFTRNWNIKSTKNGISISIARTTGNLTADINFSATFDDIVNSLVKLQSIFSANVTENTKLYDFLALSETIITNFESPAKLLIGFVNEPIDEHNMNVNRKNEKKGQAIRLGDYFVRMFLENGKFVVEPLEESSKKSQKDIATLLGLNVSKQQVGIVSTTVNTILLDIANKFANKEIIEVENIDGDIVRCVYYPKTDNTIETLVDVDTNQCIDVSKDNVLSANLKEALEEREEKNDDAVLTSIAQVATMSEQQIEDKIAENKEEKVAEVQTVKPEEIKAETENKPKNTRKSVTSEREKIARRSEAGGEEVVRKKRRQGLDFSEAEDAMELPNDFYETMYQAEFEEAEAYFSLAKADNIRSRFNGNRDISIGNMLLNIANSDSPYASFAKELSERLGTLKTLRIVLHPEIRNDNGQMVSGRYTYADNTIAIAANAMSSNEKLDRCVLHEILHAIVYNTVNKDQAKMYEISRIFENVKRELLKKYGYTSFEDLKQDSDSGKIDLKYDLYGLTNLDEFISEIFTNPRFIKEVNSIDKSFLSKFIDWIKSLFTKPLSDQIQSRLKEVLNNFNTNINTSTNYQNSAKAYHEDVRDKVLDEIKRTDVKLSTVNFVTNLTKKANEDGAVNTLLSKLQEVNASETRENLADLIRYIGSFESQYVVNNEELQSIKEKAIADGTFMKAPNGKPTNLNERQWLQVRTKAFKDWFGDWENDAANASKVVDENGEPLVVYNASPTTVTTYKKGVNFFSSDINYVKSHKATDPYTNKEVEVGYGKNVNGVFLNIKNPKVLGENDGLNTSMAENILKRNPDVDGIIGHDAMFNDNIDLGWVSEGTEYVTSNPNQIKSATDNVGTFSRENNDITDNLYSMSDSELVEKYYDVLADNEVNTLFSNIAETLKLCKDPDFILSLRKNSNIQENNDVNSKINSNFASILEQQDNKCN